MAFFLSRKKENADPHGVDAARAHFANGFKIVYERKPGPSPGAQAYALETYGLPPFPPSGPSITTRKPLNPTAAPLYHLQSVPIAGIGTTAGMIYGQPLFDPNIPGFVGASPRQLVFVPNVVDPTKARDNRVG